MTIAAGDALAGAIDPGISSAGELGAHLPVGDYPPNHPTENSYVAMTLILVLRLA